MDTIFYDVYGEEYAYFESFRSCLFQAQNMVRESANIFPQDILNVDVKFIPAKKTKMGISYIETYLSGKISDIPGLMIPAVHAATVKWNQYPYCHAKDGEIESPSPDIPAIFFGKLGIFRGTELESACAFYKQGFLSRGDSVDDIYARPAFSMQNGTKVYSYLGIPGRAAIYASKIDCSGIVNFADVWYGMGHLVLPSTISKDGFT